jgi:hypothetical protein
MWASYFANLNCVKTACFSNVGFPLRLRRLASGNQRLALGLAGRGVSIAELERVAQRELYQARRADLARERCEGRGACCRAVDIRDCRTGKRRFIGEVEEVRTELKVVALLKSEAD